MRKVWRSFSRFWDTDRGLSLFLIMIVVAVFILPPLGSLGIFGRFIFDIFFSLLLISGIASMSGQGKAFIIITGIAVIALVFRWTDSLIPSPTLYILNYIRYI